MTEEERLGNSVLSLNRTNRLACIALFLNILMVIVIRYVGSQMYPFFISVYLWIPLYGLMLLLLLRRDRLNATSHDDGKRLYFVILLTVFARLPFVGNSQTISLDPLWYLDFGKYLRSGVLPYTGFYFPYPPVFAYFILAVSLVYPAIDGFRLLATLADVVVVWLLCRIGKVSLGLRSCLTLGIAYALLPVSVIESGWLGHFEAISNSLMFASLLLLFQGRARTSGIALGLAVATKIYPLALAPFSLFYLRKWKARLEYCAAIVASAGMTFLPFYVLSLMGGASSEGPSSLGAGFLSTLLGSLFNRSLAVLAADLPVVAGILAVIVFAVWQLARPEARSRRTMYYATVGVMAVVISTMAALAAIYPLTPVAQLVYWRYPVEIGLAKGITTIIVVVIMLAIQYRVWRSPARSSVSREQVLILSTATILLLLSISRDVFYGWYLLWSIPFFLLLRDKRLGYAAIMCLLLLYPSYTQDNFAALGYEENKLWSDPFSSVEGWSSYLNVSDSGLDPSHFNMSLQSDGEYGHFGVDVSGVANLTRLENVTLCYVKSDNITFDSSMEFVARISSSWDTAFGSDADFSLSYSGSTSSGKPIAGSIVPRTSLFTNLTFIVWRFAFSTIIGNESWGTVHNLTLAVHPRVNGAYEYVVDFFYTTHVGVVYSPYLVGISLLMACSLTTLVLLDYELRKVEYVDSRREQENGSS